MPQARLIWIVLALVGLCVSCTRPLPRQDVMIVRDGVFSAATISEAVAAVGFSPVFPTTLLPGVVQRPVVVVARLNKPYPSNLELQYVAQTEKSQNELNEFSIIVDQEMNPGVTRVAGGAETTINGTVVSHLLQTNEGPHGPLVEFYSVWNKLDIRYRLRIYWFQQESLPLDGGKKLTREALDIAKSMIQVADR